MRRSGLSRILELESCMTNYIDTVLAEMNSPARHLDAAHLSLASAAGHSVEEDSPRLASPVTLGDIAAGTVQQRGRWNEISESGRPTHGVRFDSQYFVRNNVLREAIMMYEEMRVGPVIED